MKRMGKKLLGLALALVLVLTLMPVEARAETGGDWTYTVSDGKATITQYTGAGGSVTIPSALGGYPVTEIGDNAFFFCTGLTAVTIPGSVTDIGVFAFGGCSGLTAVTIPGSVTTIGSDAFYGCTGLTAVSIPGSVTYIGPGAFPDCTGLTKINVAADNSHYCSADGVLFSKDKKTLIQYPAGRAGSYAIPGSVTDIGWGAFSGCSGLTAVTIPGSVTDIGWGAFSDCSGLTAITIPESVTTIKYAAFSGCTGLTAVSIPDSVTSIGLGAFSGCTGLTAISIPGSVTDIGGLAFSGCSGLTAVTIPGSVTTIGTEAFYGCTGLTAVSIPGSVNTIGDGAFLGCTGLKDVYYSGTSADWNKISIDNTGNGNDPLLSATIHYSGSSEPSAPLSITGVTASKSAVTVGTPVTWTASASGGSGTLQYCFYVFNGNTVVQRGEYSTAKTYTYTPNVAGTYTVRVYAKDRAGTTVTKDKAAPVSVAASAAPLTIGSVTASKSSVTAGTSITWTASASGGTGSIQYCFYVFNGNTVVQRGSYGTAKTYTYTPASTGTYTVRVYVKDGAGTTVTKDKAAPVSVAASAAPLTIGSVTASKSSVTAGASVTWTASASGGTGSLQYCFYVFKDGKIAERGSYSTAKTYTYTPATAGTYNVRVYVKDSSGTVVNKDKAAAVSVSAAALTIGTITASKSSVPAGTPVTWTAAASGGSGTLQYCFYVFKDDKIAERGSYGTAKTYTYTPTAAGTYTVRVYVKDGSGTVVNKDKAAAVSVSAAALSIGSVTASKSSVPAGTSVTWTASASGGSGSLQYCFYVFKDGKIAQRGSYGTARTYTYTPTAAGTYTVRVYVKDSAGTAVTKDNAAPVTVS